MQSLRYTNVVLTIIAVCLLFLCVNSILVCTGGKRAMPVQIVNFDAFPGAGADWSLRSRSLRGGESLKVKITNPEDIASAIDSGY